MTLPIVTEWPTALPLPFIDYSGSVVNATIVSPMDNIVLERRSRFRRAYGSLSVSWRLTGSEFSAFRDFHDVDLGNGIAQFKIELRYPKESVLTEWAVRFTGGYTSNHDDGVWTVQASLDILNPIEF